MAPLPIIIAGAGLGGLVLAQGLKRHHVPFQIFERDAAFDSRAQGYRIRLRQEGIDVLQRLLPPDLLKEVEATSAHNRKPDAVRDAATGEPRDTVTMLMMSGQMAKAGPPPKTLLVDRSTLRRVLLIGLEEQVVFGKSVKAYETGEDGVDVFFTDGTSTTGAVLVGAEGRASAVARQLLGTSHPLTATGQTLYYGRAPMTDELVQQIGEDNLAGFQIIFEDYGEPKGLFAVMEAVRFLRPKPYGTDDYISFVIAGYDDEWHDGAAAAVSSADKPLVEDAKSRIVERTRSWHPSLRALYAHVDPAQITKVAVACADPDRIVPWPINRRVTVMGDAAHTMTPWGAFGGSTTMMDAEGLCAVLVSAWQQGKGAEAWGVSEEAMGQWDAEVRERGKKMMAVTLDRGKAIFRARPLPH